MVAINTDTGLWLKPTEISSAHASANSLVTKARTGVSSKGCARRTSTPAFCVSTIAGSSGGNFKRLTRRSGCMLGTGSQSFPFRFQQAVENCVLRFAADVPTFAQVAFTFEAQAFERAQR